MTRDRDFKDLVRARMRDTDQPYTAARAALEAEQAEWQAYYDRTVATFFAGATLRSVPVKRKARVIVLLELLRRFEPDRDYPEREVNDLLRPAHEDVAYLRRELVDYGYLTRAGGVYRVAERLPERDVVTEVPIDEIRRFREARASAADER